MFKKLIIGFSGHIGSGKNYIAEHIFVPCLIDGFRRNEKTKDKIILPYYFSFGDTVKIECLSRIPYNNLSSNDGFHEFFIEKSQSTRSLLQKYGTENGRNVYHEDIWIRSIDTLISIQLERLKKFDHNYLPVFIISDVRFINEYKYIESNNGIIIRIDAPNRSLQRILKESNNDPEIIKQIKSHKSETELDHYQFKYLIDNDDINDINDINLNNKIKDIINLAFINI